MSEKSNDTQSDTPPEELLFNGRPYSLIAYSSVRDDESIQVRHTLNKEKLSEYTDIVRSDIEAAEAAAALEGDPQFMRYFKPTLPPIEVWRDENGLMRRSDGGHRSYAYKENNCVVIPAFVNSGDKRDAKWHAMGANNHYGLPLTVNEKREIVIEILDDAKWSKKSDRDIAKYVGVSHTFVSQLRTAFALALANGEYDPAGIRKLITLLNKQDRGIADDLKAGKITPQEAEDLYERAKAKRESEAGEREQKKRDKADTERLASSDSASHQETYEPKIDSPGDRGSEKLAVADSRQLSDEDWLATLPNFVALQKSNPDAADRFRIDALNYLSLEETGVLELLRQYTQPSPEPTGYPFTSLAHKLATLPHPRYWALIVGGRDFNPYVSTEVIPEPEVEEEEEPEDPTEHEPDLMEQLQGQFPSDDEESGYSGEEY